MKGELECARCGSELDRNGMCTDETCPFSDRAQNDPTGWTGHCEVDPRPDDDAHLVTPEDVRRAGLT